MKIRSQGVVYNNYDDCTGIRDKSGIYKFSQEVGLHIFISSKLYIHLKNIKHRELHGFFFCGTGVCTQGLPLEPLHQLVFCDGFLE
jgi:hypothetical protein